MQKNILIGVGALVLIGLIFWGFSSRDSEMDSSTDSTISPQAGSGQKSENGVIKEVQETMEEVSDASAGVKTWIDAVVLGKKLKCTYAQDDGSGWQAETVMFVDGKKYRTEFSGGGMQYVSVFDGETMYTWTEGQKQGFMMNLQCMEEFGEMYSEEGADEEQTYYESSEEAIESIPDISCSEVDSVDVSVPSDVTFVDQCEMIKEQTEQLQDLQDQMPEEMRAMLE